jgi:hypothetical protein
MHSATSSPRRLTLSAQTIFRLITYNARHQTYQLKYAENVKWTMKDLEYIFINLGATDAAVLHITKSTCVVCLMYKEETMQQLTVKWNRQIEVC